MPTTRRSTGGARARPGPAKGQSTISFSNKVTKSVPKDAKKAALTESAVKKIADGPPAEEEVEEVQAEETVEETAVIEILPEKSEAEVRAKKITNAQVSKYWKKIEAERIAPRVHQQDLSLGEKVLRYFDVSSQYGVSLVLDVVCSLDILVRANIFAAMHWD
jgi:DNA polymerase delta subunit 4